MVILVPILSIQLAHASTYVGYGSAQADSATCTGSFCTQCDTADCNTQSFGLMVQAPFGGTLISASAFIGTVSPNQIVILTTGIANPAISQGSGCTSNACFQVNSGQSFTIQDVEGISGFSTLAFNTVALASPVTVSASQWVAIVWMLTTNIPPGPNGILMSACGGSSPVCSSFGTTVAAITFDFGTTTPSVSANVNTATYVRNPVVTGGTFQATGAGGPVASTTQCYGNCGTPPITLVNTNSTHNFAFNQSITVLYEFQSNLNGFLLNVTTNVAKTYTNGEIMKLAVYTISSCPTSQTPFSSQCPGLQTNIGTIQNLVKGRSSLASLRVPVANGQWIGIAVTAIFSGLDLNDTNSNVGLFQTNEGSDPTVIQNAVGIGQSKMGLWAWILGNVVTSGPPTTSGLGGCTNFATLDCFFANLVNSFCSNVTVACQTGSAIFWTILFTVITIMLMAYGESRMFPGSRTHALIGPELAIIVFLGYLFMMAGIGVLTSFVIVFFIIIASLGLNKTASRYF